MEHLNEFNKANKAIQGSNRPDRRIESTIGEHSLTQHHSIENFTFELIHPATKGRTHHRLEETYTLAAIYNDEKVLNDLEFLLNLFISFYFQST